MTTHLKTQAVYVTDQSQALAFFIDKLDFEVRQDRPIGPTARWLEVAPPGATSAIVLYPRSMMLDWEQRRPSILFACADTRATHAALAARGVPFKEPPHQMNWGVFMDPDGNEFGLTDAA